LRVLLSTEHSFHRHQFLGFIISTTKINKEKSNRIKKVKK
jgi:hypothetical protein